MGNLKDVKKIIMGLLIICFFSFLSQNALGATTIGNTTFPADVGKTYTWKVTYPPEAKGAKFTLRIESIEKGVHYSMDALMVNCTIRIYYPMMGWMTVVDNELYMAANSSQNYLEFEEYLYPCIIPTPLNLNLVAEAMYAFNYSIVNNKIIENDFGDISEYTFNDNGFMTSFVSTYEGEMESKIVLDTGGDAAVTFGHFFLIFMVVSVIALIYLKKQKIK